MKIGLPLQGSRCGSLPVSRETGPLVGVVLFPRWEDKLLNMQHCEQGEMPVPAGFEGPTCSSVELAGTL
jgi:hypothetical protein